jgi:hypothetical protein
MILYGVWIRGTGWLRGTGGIVSFAEKVVAEDTARRVRGEVRFVDDALRDLEQNILSIEAQQPSIRKTIAAFMDRRKTP